MKRILILLTLLLAIMSVSAYTIPNGTFNVYESIGHYHKALVELGCIDQADYMIGLDVYKVQSKYYNKYIDCISEPNYEVSNNEFKFQYMWDNPNVEVLEHHKYNDDIVYYTNSRNRSIWMPLDEFNNYSWIYGTPKIDRLEKKGEIIKLKFSSN